MSQALIEQLKQARLSRIESGNVVFIITRPTELDLALQKRIELNERSIFAKYVVGWEKITEKHILGSGDNEPVEFDSELFKLWIEDHSEHWMAISTGIREAYTSYQTRLEESTKN